MTTSSIVVDAIRPDCAAVRNRVVDGNYFLP